MSHYYGFFVPEMVHITPFRLAYVQIYLHLSYIFPYNILLQNAIVVVHQLYQLSFFRYIPELSHFITFLVFSAFHHLGFDNRTLL